MNYDKMTIDEFDFILSSLIDEVYAKSHSGLLKIPGIYEILSEHFNNKVLERWESDQPVEDEDEDEDE